MGIAPTPEIPIIVLYLEIIDLTQKLYHLTILSDSWNKYRSAKSKLGLGAERVFVIRLGYRNGLLDGRLISRLAATFFVMILVTPRTFAAPMCFGTEYSKKAILPPNYVAFNHTHTHTHTHIHTHTHTNTQSTAFYTMDL